MRSVLLFSLALLPVLTVCSNKPTIPSANHYRTKWTAVGSIVAGDEPAANQVGAILKKGKIPFVMDGSVGWVIYVPPSYGNRSAVELKKSFPTNELYINVFLKP